MSISKYTTPSAAGAEVDRRCERYMAEHGCGYREAWHAILAADPELATAYAQPATRVTATVAQGIPAGDIVHSRVQALIAEQPGLDYCDAMGCVLNAGPVLKSAYGGR